MKIDKIGEGHYQTRSGLPVRIYALDGYGEFPIHGAILVHNNWKSHKWKINGLWKVYGEVPYDLIPVAQPEPKQERPVDVGIPYTNDKEREAAIKQAESYGYKEWGKNEKHREKTDDCILLDKDGDWSDYDLGKFRGKTIPLDRSFMEAEEPVVKKNFTTENFTFPASVYTKTENEDGTITLTPRDKDYEANYEKALNFLDGTPEVMWSREDLAKILVEFLNSVK